MNEHKDCEKNYRKLVDKLGVVLNLPTVKESGMISVEDIRKLVPELKEAEGEIIKKELIAAFQNGVAYNSISKERAKDYISWIEKHKQTPQWMIDFLNEHRSHFGVPMDYDEHREVEGKLFCIKQWLEGNFVEQKIQPKFKVGDVMRTLEEAADGFTDGMPVVVSIDDEDYHCTNERIAIKDQDEYEYPPMNRKQESAEWSEEDEELLKKSLENLTELKDRFGEEYGRVGGCIDWLKSLKDRVLSTQEWSEEDEKRVGQICEDLRCGLKNFEANKNVKGLHCRETIESNIDWMKNTLPKPQCRWKPTEEQIKALDFYLKDDIDKEGVFGKRIVELRNDLKKLKD